MRVRNKIVSAILGAVLIFSSLGMCASATETEETPDTEVSSVDNSTEDLVDWPQGPSINSEAGIVMDIDSGAILYAKNIDEQHYPASITKIMTALVALENYELDETVKFTWDDIRFLEYGDAHIGIKPDEELTMEDCLYGMLLASANEVSHGIGAHMEGGYEAFLEEMNETAEELGCKNSHWMNTHGLHDEQHYTSARDMALIGAAAFQHEDFRKITGTYQHVIPETNITAEKRYVHQNHKMLRDWDSRYYEYCVGGKTGYTDQALSTLVTFATKEDVNLVAVVLKTHGGGNNTYVDTRAMLDFAFDNFAKVPVTKDMIGNKNIAKVEKNACVMLPTGVSTDDLEMNFVAPTEKKDRTGTVSFAYNGLEVGTVNVTITEDYYNEIHGIEDVVETKDEKKIEIKIPFILKLILIIIGVVTALFVGLVLYVAYKRKQIEERRRQRRMEYRRQRELE